MSHPVQRALREEVRGLEPLTETDIRNALERLGTVHCGDRTVLVTNTGLTSTDREHTHTATFAALTHLWEPTDLDPLDPEALTSRVRAWNQTRPVTNFEAFTQGLAALDWNNGSDPVWQVFAARGNHLLPWIPQLTTDATDLHAIRAAAWRRSQERNHHERTYGEMTVWTHRTHPGLSSCILADAEWIADLDVRDMYVVLSPNLRKPVLTCPHGEATRLQGTSSQPMIVQHASQLRKFRWQ